MTDFDKQAQILVGRIIKAVRYLSEAEADAHDWAFRPIVIELDDGTFIYPSQDDEGNEAGTLFTSRQDLLIIPTKEF